MLRLVAALALLLATAVGCSTTRPFAAVVNGERIEESELYSAMDAVAVQEETQGSSVQGVIPDSSYQANAVADVLGGLINFALVEQIASELGVEATEEDIKSVEAELARPELSSLVSRLDTQTRKDLVTRQALTRSVARALVAEVVDEAALREIFETNRDTFVCASVIFVADLSAAQDAERRIRAGEEFEAVFDEVVVAADLRQVDGRVCMTAAEWRQIDADLFAALEALGVGGLSRAIGTPVGGFVVRREEVRFGDVREQLVAQQGYDEGRLLAERVADKSLAAEVDVNPRFGVWIVGPGGGTVQPPSAPTETGEDANPLVDPVSGFGLAPGNDDGQIVVPQDQTAQTGP